MRDAGNREGRKKYWWRHGETVLALRAAFAPLKRYIATPRVAKHRMFTWLNVSVLPDSRLYAIAREDDAAFGVLSTRIHEIWALANASMHGVGNDPTYNAKSCFETFPFPEGLTPNLEPADYSNPAAAEIATSAQALNKLRENWLNPPEWANWVRTPEEEKAGYPARPVAKPGHEADLKKRTLTNLYNARPAWLDNAQSTGCCCRQGLRLERLHDGDNRRRNPAPLTGNESGASAMKKDVGTRHTSNVDSPFRRSLTDCFGRGCRYFRREARMRRSPIFFRGEK